MSLSEPMRQFSDVCSKLARGARILCLGTGLLALVLLDTHDQQEARLGGNSQCGLWQQFMCFEGLQVLKGDSP